MSSLSTAVTVRHNFETAHRLPHLGGKCTSLHGHSWWCEITVTGPDRADGTVCEFGQLKHALRGWVDDRLDHGVMLGAGDPLVDALTADEGTKLFLFGRDNATDDAWPTVEAVARLLHAVTTDLTADHDVRVTRVLVRETHVNQAELTSSPP